MKRIFDVLVASVAIAILLIPIVLIAVVVRFGLGRPVLFKQLRPGLYGEPFELLKFRTMTEATDSGARPLPDAERMTRLGSFLRAWSLDELPELLNVLRGDMSLVGPRPLLMEYLPLYSSEQHRRHEMKPGLTGWAQVNGRNALSWPEKLRLDVWYVDHQSFWLDLKIIGLTCIKVLLRDGIRQKGHVTTEPFKGER